MCEQPAVKQDANAPGVAVRAHTVPGSVRLVNVRKKNFSRSAILHAAGAQQRRSEARLRREAERRCSRGRRSQTHVPRWKKLNCDRSIALARTTSSAPSRGPVTLSPSSCIPPGAAIVRRALSLCPLASHPRPTDGAPAPSSARS